MIPRNSLLIALLLLLPPLLHGQELKVHPTPFSAWLDFQNTRSTMLGSLPIWMESLQRNFTPGKDGTPDKTNFRIRLRRLGQLQTQLQLRLYFKDQTGASPIISGWTETGRRLYQSEPLGTGLNLASSQSLVIPVDGIDYLDIDVPGDGSSIRGAFVATLQNQSSLQPMDFEPASRVGEPFTSLPTASPEKNDSMLMGRVKATIDPEPIKLSPNQLPRSVVQFDLESAPLIAVLSFEVLNVDPTLPPELSVNDHPLGRAALHLPDLADPGYHGVVRSLDPDMHFQYAGWIRCQQVISGSKLLSGLNKLAFTLNKQSGPIAIRSVQIELKYPSRHLDYELIP